MIVTEDYKVREDGVLLVRTYSDAGKMIERDGVTYEAAVDPAELGRIYTETDIDIELTADEALDELREVLV
jgi:hypothetical protein